MKLCNGCKHYVKTVVLVHDFCSADDPEWDWVTDPHTGRQKLRPVGGRYMLRPTVGEMRAPGARCGPDAVLWEPNLRRRFWHWLLRRTGPIRPTERA